jgi:hypothetical protein
MDEKTEKALKKIKPLAFYQDFQDVKSGRFATAGHRIKKRARIVISVLFLGSLTFMINGFFHFIKYFETGTTSTLINGIMWIVLTLLSLFLALNSYRNMSAVGKWLIKKGDSSEESILSE